jgi:hypothetical protein
LAQRLDLFLPGVAAEIARYAPPNEADNWARRDFHRLLSSGILPHFSRRPRGVVKVSCARGPDENLPVEPDVFGLTPAESRAREIELLEFAATLEAAATFETRVVLSLQ